MLKEPKPKINHIWIRADLVTRIDDRGVAHDPMRCTGCGIKGLGIGIPRVTQRHREWRDTRFENCDTTKYYIEHNKFPPKKKVKKIKHNLDDILEFLKETWAEDDEIYEYEDYRDEDFGVEWITWKRWKKPFQPNPVDFYKGELYFFQNIDVETGFYQLAIINDPRSRYPLGSRQFRRRNMVHQEFRENSVRTTEITERAFIQTFWNKSGLSDKFTKWMKTKETN